MGVGDGWGAVNGLTPQCERLGKGGGKRKKHLRQEVMLLSPKPTRRPGTKGPPGRRC